MVCKGQASCTCSGFVVLCYLAAWTWHVLWSGAADCDACAVLRPVTGSAACAHVSPARCRDVYQRCPSRRWCSAAVRPACT